ncbi:cytochrome bd oxidase small subunit CydS [Paenibacillus sp. Soil766]
METILIQSAPMFVLFSLVFMVLWVIRASDVTE